MPFDSEESGCSVCITNVIMIAVLGFLAAVIKIILAEPHFILFYSFVATIFLSIFICIFPLFFPLFEVHLCIWWKSDENYKGKMSIDGE